MPTKPKTTPANKPQPFQQTLAPAFPVAPTITVATPHNRTLIAGSSIVVLAALGGILGGLALRSELAPTVTVTPGNVSVVTNPQYARIVQAKAVAASGSETVQPTSAQSLQTAQTVFQIQNGSGINSLQPDLSAYDSQGSVNGPAVQ